MSKTLNDMPTARTSGIDSKDRGLQGASDSQVSGGRPAGASHWVDNAIEVVSPPENVRVAEPTKLELKVHSSKIVMLYAEQYTYINDDTNSRLPIDRSTVAVPVMSGNGSDSASKIIMITPMHLGMVGLRLFGRLADGGVFSSTISLHVVEPSKPAKQLVVGAGGIPDLDVGIYKVALKTFIQTKNTLDLSAVFTSVLEPIRLDPKSVVFNVKQDKEHPAISFDPQTATITPLRTGHALVRTTWSGVTNLTCVVVVERPDIFDKSHCEDLRAPGEKLSLPTTGPNLVIEKPN